MDKDPRDCIKIEDNNIWHLEIGAKYSKYTHVTFLIILTCATVFVILLS